MTDTAYINYISQFGEHQKRSMFGGIGLFQDNAMFALLSDDSLFIRGGNSLDKTLTDLDCEKYRHVKKQTIATVNYYDITDLFKCEHPELDSIIRTSIDNSVKQRSYKNSSASRRLRDLPNMQLTLERMVKKAGVDDVSTFMQLGAPEVFNKVRKAYGNDVDLRLLWKFAGAIDGIHWKLLQEPRKQQLLKNCH
ncbi:TfoX/Sxy family DNA transformation protein [uncultured Vibrio sp.]|uniref:TfoX/Sxy family DNA transformation protein n=1 Tax=uncultured Vibrio sp. TaxID=114054 RepID=UPI00262BF4B3|nr:TfoX/Sxy family DNA transformation protein [uncultured Vibrio sp.]